MALTIDHLSETLYPLEVFPLVDSTDLAATENAIATYSIKNNETVLGVTNFSFDNSISGLELRLAIDDNPNLQTLDLELSSGLLTEENMKFLLKRLGKISIKSNSAISDYRMRYNLLSYGKPTILQKIYLGIRLNDAERELARKYKLGDLAKQTNFKYSGYSENIDLFYTAARKITESSGTVTILDKSLNRGEKLIIYAITASGFSAVNQGTINIKRDDKNALAIEPYALPNNLNYRQRCRIVATENAKVTYDVSVAGTRYVKIWYGIGKITILDKLKWNRNGRKFELTDAEQKVVDAQNLVERVEAGVV